LEQPAPGEPVVDAEPVPESEREPEPESVPPPSAVPERSLPEPDAWALPEPPVAQAPEPEPPPEAPRPSLVRLEPLDEEEGVRIIGPVSQPPAPAAATPSARVEPLPAPEPEPEPQLEALQPEAQAEAEHEGSVDDLFARLRAERQTAVINAEKVLTAEQPKVAAAEPESASEAEVEVEVEVEAEVEAADDEAGDGDRLLLERRDECLEPVASDLVRRLKRVLQDEQNEILDRLRQNRGRNRPEEALPSATDQASRYRDAAVAPLAEGATVGGSFNGHAPADALPAREGAQALADELVGGLRDRITRSLAAVGESGDGTEAADILGAAYRQWKTERIDQIARHHLAMAFNEGVLAGAPEGSALRWVFGDAGPCPDCDDNALAGATPKGEAYPTGQRHPPAHAGCGCVLVAVPGQPA